MSFVATSGDGCAIRWRANKSNLPETIEFHFRRIVLLGIILGIFVILLGAKAFTPKGLPLTKEKNLTGTPAKVIGVVCIVLGVAFIADGVLASFSIINLLGGGGR